MVSIDLKENEKIPLLTGSEDLYSGVTVDEKLLAKTPALFERQLEQSIAAWRTAKRRGIWLSIPHNRTELIPVAQKLGFVLHHAKADCVMLTHWLDEKEPNQLPSYATLTVGVGGLVVNKKREVLLIQERYYDIDDYFKLPGGSLNTGESIEDGIEREVFEETGIRAHFRGILTFTHELNFRFENSDIYFACLMSLDENDQEQKIVFDPGEIAACKWMPLDQWANSPEMHPEGIIFHFAHLAMAVLDGREQLFEPNRIQIESQDPNKPPWERVMYRKKIDHEK